MRRTTFRMMAAILTLCGAMTAFTSCNKDDDEPTNGTQTPSNPSEPDTPTLPEARFTDTVRYDNFHMTAFNFEYPSTDPYGQPVTLSGAITIGDEVTKDSAARGILLYNHYTVYRADQCPSRGDLVVQKIAVGSGLITVAADYYGFGVTQAMPQAYCVPSANAQASIDALIAAKQLMAAEGYTWDDPLFSVGYSQGGQTTIGVLKLATEKYPDIRFTHCFGGGGPYDIPTTYRRFIQSDSSAMPATVVSVLYTYNDIFHLGIEMSDMFREPLLSNYHDWFTAKRYTQAELEALIGTEKLSDIINPVLLDTTSDLSRRFFAAMEQENLCKGWTPRTDEQLTIVHNISDRAVPVENAQSLEAFLRSKGLTISEDDWEVQGVYVRIEDFRDWPGTAPAHEFGAMFFLSNVLQRISHDLGIEVWFTPTPSTLEELLQ